PSFAGPTPAISPDSQTLAYMTDIQTLSLWQPATGKVVRQFKHPRRSFHAISFSPDGKSLTATTFDSASPTWDGTVQLWDVASGKELLPVGKIETQINDVSFAPDGRTLAQACADGVVRIWEMRTRQKRCEFRPPEGALLTLAYSPDSQRLALG